MSSERAALGSTQRAHSIQTVRESEAARQSKVTLSPTLSDVKREMGRSAKYEEHPDGSWTATVKDPSKFERAASLLDSVRRVESDHGALVQSKVARTSVRTRNGKVAVIPEAHVEQMKKHGITPIWRPGGLRCRRGPDGMFFRLLPKGWDPTGRTVLGLAEGPEPVSPQRDPDGGTWVKVDGRWRLDTEL